jgi:hypothetical protein
MKYEIVDDLPTEKLDVRFSFFARSTMEGKEEGNGGTIVPFLDSPSKHVVERLGLQPALTQLIFDRFRA